MGLRSFVHRTTGKVFIPRLRRQSRKEGVLLLL